VNLESPFSTIEKRPWEPTGKIYSQKNKLQSGALGSLAAQKGEKKLRFWWSSRQNKETVKELTQTRQKKHARGSPILTPTSRLVRELE